MVHLILLYRHSWLSIHVLPRSGKVWGTENVTFLSLDLLYQIHAWATEQKAYVFLYLCIHVCVFSVWHTQHWGHVRLCILCLFWAFGCWCVFYLFFPPQHCLDCQSQLSNTSPSERQAEFTLFSISPPLCAHVSMCVSAHSRASMWRWVGDPLFIATAIPLCHQYLICHATCQRRMGDNRPVSPTVLHPEVNFILVELQMCATE